MEQLTKITQKAVFSDGKERTAEILIDEEGNIQGFKFKGFAKDWQK